MDQITKYIRDLNTEKIIKYLFIFLIFYGLFLLFTSDKNKSTGKEYYGANNTLNASCSSVGGGEDADDYVTTIKWTNRDGIITDMDVTFLESDYNSDIYRVYLQVGDKSPVKLSEETTETAQIFSINDINPGVIKNGDILRLVITTAADVSNVCGNKPVIEISSRKTLSY